MLKNKYYAKSVTYRKNLTIICTHMHNMHPHFYGVTEQLQASYDFISHSLIMQHGCNRGVGTGDTDDTMIYRNTKYSRYWYR